jgi:maltose O-acetyltransferase
VFRFPSRVNRALWLVLYYGVLARLPPSSAGVIGQWARRCRGAAGKRLFRECGTSVNIERHASFGSGAHLKVGSHSGIGRGARVQGPVTIGDHVLMGPEVLILTSNHEYRDASSTIAAQGDRPSRAVVIEDDVWLGARAVVLPGRTIGRGAVVAAAAVVSSDVPEYAVVAGNPAVVVATRGRS